MLFTPAERTRSRPQGGETRTVATMRDAAREGARDAEVARRAGAGEMAPDLVAALARSAWGEYNDQSWPDPAGQKVFTAAYAQAFRAYPRTGPAPTAHAVRQPVRPAVALSPEERMARLQAGVDRLEARQRQSPAFGADADLDRVEAETRRWAARRNRGGGARAEGGGPQPRPTPAPGPAGDDLDRVEEETREWARRTGPTRQV